MKRIVLCTALLSAACTPAIELVAPETAEIGDQVTVTGSKFGDAAPETGGLKFANAVQAVDSWAADKIVFTIPEVPALGKYDVLVDKDGSTSESASITITDVTEPDTSMVTAPAELTNSADAEIYFSSLDLHLDRFECDLDAAGFVPCESPYGVLGLVDGEHTVFVRAVDWAENVDSSPAGVTWTVDTTSPDTQLTTSITDPTNEIGGSISFSSADADTVSFLCSLDMADFAACTSPQALTNLVEGTHNFRVAAVDHIGNVDPTPAEFEWKVDLTPPETSLTAFPDAQTYVTDVTFAFESTSADVDYFECSLNGVAYSECASPVTHTSLDLGSYTFSVRAVDFASNADTSPAMWSFEIVDRSLYFISIDSVSPKYANRSQRTQLTLAGSDLPAGVTAEIFNDNGFSVELSFPVTITDTEAVATLASNSVPLSEIGFFSIRIFGPISGSSTLSYALLVTDSPIPEIDAIKPDLIDGVGETIQLEGSALDGVTVAIVDTSGALLATSLGVSNPTLLDVTTPTLTAGEAYVVRAFKEIDGVTVTTDAGPLLVIQANRKFPAASTATPSLSIARYRHAQAGVTDDIGNAYVMVAGGAITNPATMLTTTVEISSLDSFGKLNGFRTARSELAEARQDFSLIQNGDWLYAIGGITSSGAITQSIERARILSLDDAPDLQDVDASSSGGLASGVWSYRVAALFGSSDARGPDGESLSSGIVAVYNGSGGSNQLTWKPVAGATGYSIYRNSGTGQSVGKEQRLDVAVGVCASTCSYTDDGSASVANPVQSPLVVGDLSPWKIYEHSLQIPRAMTPWVAAEVSATTVRYAYGIGGVTVDTSTPDDTFESLELLASGELTWATKGDTAGDRLQTPRISPGVAVATTENTTIGISENYLYLFGGYTDQFEGSASRNAERIQVAAGGGISGAWNSSNCGFNGSCNAGGTNVAGTMLLITSNNVYVTIGDGGSGVPAATAKKAVFLAGGTDLETDGNFTANDGPPTARLHHSYGRIRNHIYFIGGLDASGNLLRTIDSIAF